MSLEAGTNCDKKPKKTIYFLKWLIHNHNNVLKENRSFYSAPFLKPGRWIIFKNILST